uniref:Thioredoxin domain-containing protein n=1 Tax=Opuntia streptacantha TaxID=393608 RepID=A0A7C8YHC1_OPUST
MGKCVSKHHTDQDESSHFNFAGGNVHLVNSQEDWEGKLSEANREGKIVVANFSASWCGPCKLMAPYYVELSEKYPSLMFLVIDVDQMTVSIKIWFYRVFTKSGSSLLSVAFCSAAVGTSLGLINSHSCVIFVRNGTSDNFCRIT